MRGNEGKGTGRNSEDRNNDDNCMFTITVDADFLIANICRGRKTTSQGELQKDNTFAGDYSSKSTIVALSNSQIRLQQ